MRQRNDVASYQLPDGQTAQLGDKIASGGEGIVYHVTDNPQLVAKVYRPDKRPTQIDEKLRAMITRPPGGMTAQSVAWPMARLLSTQDGSTCGYLMKKALPCAIPAAVFTSRKLRRSHRGIGNRSRAETQAIMAKIIGRYANTMQELHDSGYAIGDVNDKNLLAWPNGDILILDADSFQVHSQDGNVFRCLVGRPEYQPPEILSAMLQHCRAPRCPQRRGFHQANYGCIERTPDHDRFSLAVLAYQGLCDGRHPYSGRLTPKAQPAEKSTDRIRLGYFPFHEHGKQYVQPSREQILEWAALTPELQEYFKQAFQPA